MNMIYNKDTLYVDLDGPLNSEGLDKLSKKVDRIMDTYNIESLVVNTKNHPVEHMHEFEWNYNKRHKNKVVIK